MSFPSPADLASEYWALRDILTGENEAKQDVQLALELASSCQHPDAQWLTKIFAGKDVKSPEEARDVFLAQGNDDARALCFAAIMVEPWDIDRLRRSADLGFGYAQAWVSLV